MIDLSVVIVNYNVSYFLEQCLHSVLRAAEGLECEIIVVDNNSVDESVAMVRSRFPGVKLIANSVNSGFSKANNQAIQISKGRYILLLNPDTLVEEDTFHKSLIFMDEHPEAGALGVKMVDGKGQFLPESKRGLPTPAVAFYKIFGLSSIFPKSRIFGRYHLGYLSENEVNQVDVLSGAFMFLRSETIAKVGMLDETFFMYGEDIDLSYRISLGGYKNYYFPKTRIIHYKGESTKKSSINYVFVFYRAMIIFAQKHFSPKHASSYSVLIHWAIYFRASLALMNRFIIRSFLPFSDAVLSYLALQACRQWYTRFSNIHYQSELVDVALGVYVGIWVVAVFLSGGYDRPINQWRVIRGLIVGTVAILAAYALLPEAYRFSRALILLGTLSTSVIMIGIRLFANLLLPRQFALSGNSVRKLGIIAGEQEYARITSFIDNTQGKNRTVFRIHPPKGGTSQISDATRLQEVVDVYKPDTLIFSGEDVSSHDIISMMSEISTERIDFKIAPPESLYIIGSNSIDREGELMIVNINAITKPVNRRKKKAFDWTIAFLLFLTYPITCWFVQQKVGYFQNLISIITLNKSFIGYYPLEYAGLPKILPGVLSPLDAHTKVKQLQDTARKLNTIYARDYSLRKDVSIIWRSFKKLGRTQLP